MDEIIGVIGTVQMGKPIAKNILRCGYPLMVYNRTLEKAEAIPGNGIF